MKPVMSAGTRAIVPPTLRSAPGKELLGSKIPSVAPFESFTTKPVAGPVAPTPPAACTWHAPPTGVTPVPVTLR